MANVMTTPVTCVAQGWEWLTDITVQRSILAGDDEESNANPMDRLSGIYDKLVRVQSQSTFVMTCDLRRKNMPQQPDRCPKCMS